MQGLDSSKIVELEQTVKEDFATFVSNAENAFNCVDSIHIFGFYGKNVNRFRFLPGHRSDLERLADQMKKYSNFDHFQMPQGYRIPRKSIVRTPIGFLYGSKTRAQNNFVLGNVEKINGDIANNSEDIQSTSESKPLSTQPGDDTNNQNNSKDIQSTSEPMPLSMQPDDDTNNQKSIILLRVNAIVEPLNITLSQEDISFISDGLKVTAYVFCKNCRMQNKPKKIAVQFETSSINSCKYWNFSNFIKHVNKHIKNTEEMVLNQSPEHLLETDAECDTIENDRPDEAMNVDEEKPANISTGIVPGTEDYFTDQIFNQIAEQNQWLSKKMKSQKLVRDEMTFKLGKDRTIEFVEIRSDGNCLFSALAHQIYGFKPNSVKNTNAAKTLRLESANYIIKNYENFNVHIVGRLYEENERNALKLSKDLTEQGMDFVKNKLTKRRVWGGMESIKAISESNKLNILVFNEEENCRFLIDFKPEYKRTITIAYRLSHLENESPTHRNHYVSIAEVSQNILYECAVSLAKIEVKRRDLTEAMIVELTSP